MPFRYSIDKQHRLVLVVGSGRVTASEILGCIEQALQDPDFDAEFDEFTDLREATGADIDGYQVRALARRKLYSPQSRRAVLAPLPGVFGIARMWQIYTELSNDTTRFRVFYELTDALKWLGLESLPQGS